MKFDNGNEISFFKVLCSESAKYIQVPTPFAKKYMEKGTKKKKIQTIVLKTINKSHVDQWKVDFLKIKDGYYFTEGWFNFKKDNRLQKLDFLVFFLRSRSPNTTFEVFSYATNGCLKTLSIISPSVADLEHEKADDSTRKFSSDNPYYRVRIRDSYIQSSGVNANVGFCRRYLTYDKKCVTCVLHSSDGKNWGEVQCKEYRTYAKLYGKNWKKFSEENQLGVGDVCVFELLIKDTKNVLKITVFRGGAGGF